MDVNGFWWVTRGGNAFVKLEDALKDESKAVNSVTHFSFSVLEPKVAQELSNLVFKHNMKFLDQFFFDFTISDKKICQEILDILNENNIVYDATALKA